LCSPRVGRAFRSEPHDRLEFDLGSSSDQGTICPRNRELWLLLAARPSALQQFGHLLETFVVNELCKQAHWLEEPIARLWMPA
jgi:hypothetical protein